MYALHAQKDGKRRHHEIILVLPEDASDFFHHPDDHEFVVADTNGLADGIRPKKQLLHQGIADEADIGAVLRFGRSEVAAELHRTRVNIRHVCSLSGEAHVRHFFVAVSRPDSGTDGGANFLAGWATVGYGAHIIHVYFFELEGLDDDIEIGDGKGRARNLEDVGAEVCDFLLDVQVGALDEGHHGDQRSYTHGESEHGERGAELVGAQGVEAFG